MAAMAVGAVTVAAQHSVDRSASGEHLTGVTALAFGSNASAAMTGMGGDAPAPGVLPLPEVLPVPQGSAGQDISALAKGNRMATEREAAEQRARAQQAAAERAEARREAQGRAVFPVDGAITSNFGPRWGSTHEGLDVANLIGTPIVSAMAGEVIDSGPASGFGLWVRVQQQDGTIAVYGHINETLVEVGQRVEAGEQIATVGNRGNSTGPHLHFEILANGENINPMEWLQSNGADL